MIQANTTPFNIARMIWPNKVILLEGKSNVINWNRKSLNLFQIYISYWWIALYASNEDSFLWASMLFTFQWKQEKIIGSFFLGPGLISTFPCFRRSKKTKTPKQHHTKPTILKSQQPLPNLVLKCQQTWP